MVNFQVRDPSHTLLHYSNTSTSSTFDDPHLRLNTCPKPLTVVPAVVATSSLTDLGRPRRTSSVDSLPPSAPAQHTLIPTSLKLSFLANAAAQISTREMPAEKEESSAEHFGLPGEGHRDKRRRAIAACGACRARKIKCDRVYPCSACVKRGDQDTCAPIDAPPVAELLGRGSGSAASSSRSLNSSTHTELDTLRAKVASLERLVHDSRSSTYAQKPSPVDFPDSPHHQVETESAAMVLEELASAGHASNDTFAAHCANSAPAVSGSPDALFPSIVVQTNHTPLNRSLLESCFELLPPSPVLRNMVETYINTECGHGFHVLCVPQLRQEANEFLMLRERKSSLLDVDPAWLSILFTVLALTHSRLQDCETLIEGLAPDASISFSQAAHYLFSVAIHRNLPTFRCLQGILLYASYARAKPEQHPQVAAGWNTRHFATVFPQLAAHAIRIGECLNLHRLGDSPNAMPLLPDPSFPPRPTFFARQMGLRLWAMLAVAELNKPSPQSDSVLVFRDIGIVEPANLNDDDLGFDCVEARPDFELTDVTMNRIKLVLTRSTYKEKSLKRDGSWTYDSVLEVDADLQKTLAPFFSGTALKQGLLWSAEGPYRTRLLRIHRPWMLKGLSDPKYRTSFDRCLESAFALVTALAEQDHQAPLGKACFFYLVHVLGAAVTLSTVLLAQGQLAPYSSIVIACRSTVQLCQSTLDKIAAYNTSRMARSMASYLSQIIAQLKEVEELTRDQPLEGESVEQAVAARLHQVVRRVQSLDSASPSPSMASNAVPVNNCYRSSSKSWHGPESAAPALYDKWPSQADTLGTTLQLADGQSDSVCRSVERFGHGDQVGHQQQQGTLDLEGQLAQLQHAQRDPTYPMMDLSWIFQDAGPS